MLCTTMFTPFEGEFRIALACWSLKLGARCRKKPTSLSCYAAATSRMNSLISRSRSARAGRAGVRTVTAHAARRTCASRLVDLDVHPPVIMEILRHADFNVTMEIYSQASSKATRDALTRLGESLDGCPSLLLLTDEDVQNDIDRLQTGQSRFTT